jgi:hexosaminidase
VQFERYRTLGLREYADTAFEPRLRLTPGDDPGTYRVALSKQADYGAIFYAFAKDEKREDLRPYEGPFEARVGDVLSAATFDGDRALSRIWNVGIEPGLLSRRTDEELKQCSGKLVLRLEDDAPLEGERAFFNVDIVDPCWVWPDAELARGVSLRAAVGQLPFNFQIGKDADAIKRGDARTREGELEVRTGDCSGEPVAVIPLAAAAANPGVSILGPVRIPPQASAGNLCLRFSRPSIDPIWAIQWVEIGP